LALITGIAIVHTTGMPVAYSFELGFSQPYILISHTFHPFSQ